MAAERLGRVEVRLEAEYVGRLLNQKLFLYAQDGKYSVRRINEDTSVSKVSPGAPMSLRECYAFLKGMALVLEGKV